MAQGSVVGAGLGAERTRLGTWTHSVFELEATSEITQVRHETTEAPGGAAAWPGH